MRGMTPNVVHHMAVTQHQNTGLTFSTCSSFWPNSRRWVSILVDTRPNALELAGQFHSRRFCSVTELQRDDM